MNKWEYLVFNEATTQKLNQSLDKFGADGWELVSVAYRNGTPERVEMPGGGTMERPGPPMWTAILKRPIGRTA